MCKADGACAGNRGYANDTDCARNVGIMSNLQLALREWQGVLVPLIFWAICTVLTSVSGPFGTHEVLGFWPRVIYWSGICALSVGFSLVAIRLQLNQPIVKRLLVWGGFAVFLSSVIHFINAMVFLGWAGWRDHIYLLAIVLGVVALVFVTIWLFDTDRPAPLPKDELAEFLTRLPIEKRGPLVRLEAQDHYLKVVTEAGESLILLRFGDALRAVAGQEGAQVHRSHWVARTGIMQSKRLKGRDILLTRDGFEVPVSRSYKNHLKDL